jgi:hypothetical protein
MGALRLPANVVDITERAVGTIAAVLGHVGPSSSGVPNPPLEMTPDDRP